jgi:alkylation response protein AidB-like acyl-CoA dehydrogenase
VDLDLTDEQTWLAESIESLLTRGGDGTWERLVEFGALAVGEDGLGAVELCIIGHGLGRHLASTPFVPSAAVQYALAGLAESADATSVAALEPGGGWDPASAQATLEPGGVRGVKSGVEHASTVDDLAVIVGGDDGPALALVERGAPGVTIAPRDSLDPGVPLWRVELAGVECTRLVVGDEGRTSLERLMSIGGLLAAAEAVGAAGSVLDEARAYAGQRRQFGRTIGSNQALRHILADMVVRQRSSWSSVLYAAAALDGGLPDAALAASVAKAWSSRSTQEVAHGAMQVFGGIAFTQEHPAHRYLRRIVVRGQQFGDAAHHERVLGRTLARTAAALV